MKGRARTQLSPSAKLQVLDCTLSTFYRRWLGLVREEQLCSQDCKWKKKKRKRGEKRRWARRKAAFFERWFLCRSSSSSSFFFFFVCFQFMASLNSTQLLLLNLSNEHQGGQTRHGLGMVKVCRREKFSLQLDSKCILHVHKLTHIFWLGSKSGRGC